MFWFRDKCLLLNRLPWNLVQSPFFFNYHYKNIQIFFNICNIIKHLFYIHLSPKSLVKKHILHVFFFVDITLSCFYLLAYKLGNVYHQHSFWTPIPQHTIMHPQKLIYMFAVANMSVSIPWVASNRHILPKGSTLIKAATFHHSLPSPMPTLHSHSHVGPGITVHNSRRRKSEGDSTLWSAEAWKEPLSGLRWLHHLLMCLEKTSQSYLYSPCSWKLSHTQHALWRTARQQQECATPWRCSIFHKTSLTLLFCQSTLSPSLSPFATPFDAKKSTNISFFSYHLIYERDVSGHCSIHRRISKRKKAYGHSFCSSVTTPQP